MGNESKTAIQIENERLIENNELLKGLDILDTHIIMHLRSGRKVGEIAKALGIHRVTVAKRLKKSSVVLYLEHLQKRSMDIILDNETKIIDNIIRKIDDPDAIVSLRASTALLDKLIPDKRDPGGDGAGMGVVILDLKSADMFPQEEEND
jgi:hypothetical protein